MAKSTIKNYLMVIGIVVIGFTAPFLGHAEPRLNGIPTNFKEQVESLLRARGLHTQAAAGGQELGSRRPHKLLEMARDAQDSVIYMKQSDAIKYCKESSHVEQPAHLPSALDFAMIASRNCDSDRRLCGGKIFKSINQIPKDRSGNPEYPYNVIRASNVDGTYDGFYFSKASRSIFGGYSFWTSSKFPEKNSDSWIFNGNDGNLYNYANPDDTNAVICVSDTRE